MDTNDILHSGVAHDENPPGRGSGRYGWGSGENPYQHQFNFLSEVKKLKDQGLSEAEIAEALLGYDRKGRPKKSTDLRAEISIAKSDIYKGKRQRALELYQKYNGNVSAVGREMGLNESSVRNLLKDDIAARQDRYQNTADFLRSKIDSGVGIIDVSKGTEIGLGVTDHTKKVAEAILVKEGYVKSWVKIKQLGTGEYTTITVMARKPGEGETESDVHKWVQQHKFDIQPIQDYSPDEGKTWWTPEFPEMLDSKRIMVRYAEDGGKDKDGVIELRKDVDDISLGDSQYAQVRIGVDGTHYLKGMAMYGDDADFPKGIDVIFNTNKHVGTPKLDTLKELKIDPETGQVDRDNPFGALIKGPKEIEGLILASGQRKYIGEDGKEHLSVINKLRDEGDWDSWSRTLSSQFLAKQPMKLINQQLDLTISKKKVDLEEIENLTVPAIKKKLLISFADQCDAAASELRATGFKGQAFRVILPLPKMKETEIYDPNLNDGEQVALVRYPHAGIFEIPILTVNNHGDYAKKIMGGAKDAVGINPAVAEQLSGADFDGDTVLVIPMTSNRITVKAKKQLEGLKGFDPKELYKLPKDAPKMVDRTKQLEMGKVSNLITDMTVNGAPDSKIVRAVKHSMVVIDAQKHHLDYRQSEKDNNIEALKKEYQGVTKQGKGKGASTILSQAGAQVRINKRKEVTDVNKMTPEERKAWDAGMKVYHDTGDTRTQWKKNKDGTFRVVKENVPVQMKVSRMDTVRDAMELVRDPDNAKEVAYARFSNQLKGLANQARREARSIQPSKVSEEAKVTYANEIKSLRSKLKVAQSNSPRERQAQALGNALVAQRLKSNPDIDYEHKKREEALQLTRARAIVGAKKTPVDITDREWDAIQANALPHTVVMEILNNTDQDKFKQRATPRERKALTPAQISLIKSMKASGMYTNKEIADAVGTSTSTVSRALNN